MAKICPHCKKSTTFGVTLVAQGKVNMINDSYELIEQGELGIQEGTLICSECGQPVKEAELLDGLACAQCGTVHPVDELLQLQGENGQEGSIICNPCYQAMCAAQQPQTPEDIIAQKDAQLAQQAEEMKKLQEQMAQMMAMVQGQQGGAQVAATANVPQQQPQVATNIPAPNAPVVESTPQMQVPVNQAQANNVAVPTPQNTVNVGQATEVPDSKNIFGGEAPF